MDAAGGLFAYRFLTVEKSKDLSRVKTGAFTARVKNN